jgi:hypothetical protein
MVIQLQKPTKKCKILDKMAKMPSQWNLILVSLVFCCWTAQAVFWVEPYIVVSQEAADKNVTYTKGGSTNDFTISVPEKGGTIEDGFNLGTLNFQGGNWINKKSLKNRLIGELYLSFEDWRLF